MLTPRGWWLLGLSVGYIVLGAAYSIRGPETLLMLGAALGGWIVSEAIGVAVSRRGANTLSLTREVWDATGPVRVLWAGRSYEVRVTVRGPYRIGFARCRDRPPHGMTTVGTLEWSGPLEPGRPQTWSYRIHPAGCGVARFEGLAIELSDRQRFAVVARFLRQPVELPVLPVPLQPPAGHRSIKPINRMPPPGIHRHRRSGVGSELLDLRDYRPGDPPRRIAWKVSARRDRLITRDDESEVPVRATLILAETPQFHTEPLGAKAWPAVVELASLVGQTLLSERDPVGLAVCAADGVEYLAPARDRRHGLNLAEKLARAAARTGPTTAEEASALLPIADELARELYPDLMRPSLNRFPAWLAWLSPLPEYRRDAAGRERLDPMNRWLGVALFQRRLRFAVRKRLAALMAVVHRLPIGATAHLTEDDAALAVHLARFLADHRRPGPVRPGTSGAATYDRLAQFLPRAIARGRDNELFLIAADILGDADSLGTFPRAIRVARSRRHQVLIVQPWPDGWPSPTEVSAPGDRASVVELIRHAAHSRAVRAWLRLRTEFGRMGVPLVLVRPSDPPRLVLERVKRLRAATGAVRP